MRDEEVINAVEFVVGSDGVCMVTGINLEVVSNRENVLIQLVRSRELLRAKTNPAIAIENGDIREVLFNRVPLITNRCISDNEVIGRLGPECRVQFNGS